MATEPLRVPGGGELIGAPTVERLLDALVDTVERGYCSLYDTAHEVLALEDGAQKERLLVRLAAEALFYSNNLRQEREAEATRTVTLTPETHGEHVVRFDPGARSVETTDPGGVVTVTSIEEVAFKEPPMTAWVCRACHRACESASKYPMCPCGTMRSGELP